MTDTFPAPVYTETVLRANFDDARAFFLASLFDIHYAHTRMLARQGIISHKEADAIFGGLDSIDRVQLQQARYDGTHEDLFFYVEAKLAEVCDPEVAGKLHTARSRNDIAITLYRMEVRRRLLEVLASILDLAHALTTKAAEHIETVMPAHTHTQPAQPTTLAHYLLGGIELLERDAHRLQAAFRTVNVSPLGACAITTTGFPIDRNETARLLGFEGLQTNSYGAIAATDYLLEAAAAVSICMINIGKLIHDLLLWCTEEFGYLRLSDAFVQTSSIMPQKRNPVALEHARILASRAYGEAQAVGNTQHNTPFGDIVDSEDDLFPLVFLMFTDAVRALRLLTGALKNSEVNRELLRSRAGARFLTVTELADTLVRMEGLSFRQAHHLVAAVVKANPSDDSHGRIVDDVLRLGSDLHADRALLLQALDPMHFISVRNVLGGPAPQQARQELMRSGEEQARLRAWLDTKRQLLETYRAELQAS